MTTFNYVQTTTTETLPDLQALARSLNLTALAEHLPRFLKQA